MAADEDEGAVMEEEQQPEPQEGGGVPYGITGSGGLTLPAMGAGEQRGA